MTAREPSGAAHTPGPWKIRDCWISVTTDESNGIICDAPIGWPQSMNRWDANARLIAAAPDLLAALDRLLADCEDGGGPSAFSVDAAHDAITKATGGSRE